MEFPRLTLYLGLLLYCTTPALAQDILFDDFYFGMPKKEAKKVLLDHHKNLKEFEMGSGVVYTLKRNSLVMDKGKLVEVKVWTKSNLSLNQIVSGMKKTRKHFEGQGYRVVYEQEHWDNPELLNHNKPCLRLLDPKQTLLLEIEPRGQEGYYNIYLNYYNLEWFKKKAQQSR